MGLDAPALCRECDVQEDLSVQEERQSLAQVVTVRVPLEKHAELYIWAGRVSVRDCLEFVKYHQPSRSQIG